MSIVGDSVEIRKLKRKRKGCFDLISYYEQRIVSLLEKAKELDKVIELERKKL